MSRMRNAASPPAYAGAVNGTSALWPGLVRYWIRPRTSCMKGIAACATDHSRPLPTARVLEGDQLD